MKLTSPKFKQGERIPSLYTCCGKDVSPPLYIHDVPLQAKSLVLIMEDPDVPSFVREDQLWVHWIIFNMPISTKELKEGATPPGVQGIGTGGVTKYEGPCPPDREHRYFFKLYALDCVLSLSEGSTKEDIEKSIEGHVLEKAELMGRYEKEL